MSDNNPGSRPGTTQGGSAPRYQTTRPIDLHKSDRGPHCPKCNSTLVVKQSFLWIRFAKWLVAFFIAEILTQVVGSMSDDGSLFWGMLDIVSFGLGGVCIWYFLAAVFGGNKCGTCGHRWYKD